MERHPSWKRPQPAETASETHADHDSKVQARVQGQVLGQYIILERLGQGATGAVYLARHHPMNRTVALKVLAPAVARNEMSLRRFQREIQLLSGLRHPNIVVAYDAGEDHGVRFLVMEFHEGCTLAQLVGSRGPLPVGHAVSYVIQAARGLEHMHAAGVIHRDVKPSNLLVDKQGVVKVLDLGLARATNAGELSSSSSEVTVTGSILGTCQFMAPEQALDAHHAERRSDVYALGGTLYYLLTGKTMYGAGSAVETLMAHYETPIPSLCTALPQAPPELDAIYQKMVAKKPEDRYGSMAEVSRDLERFSANVNKAAPRSRVLRKLIWATAACVLLAAVCLTYAFTGRRSDNRTAASPRTSTAQAATPKATTTTAAVVTATPAAATTTAAPTEPSAERWLALLRGPESRQRDKASRALADIGAGVAPALLDAMTDSNQEVRIYARMALVRMGAAVVPTLIEALDDPKFADAARTALVKLIEAQPTLVSKLGPGLTHANTQIGVQVARCLGNARNENHHNHQLAHGLDRAGVRGVLKQGLAASKDVRVRVAIAWALTAYEHAPVDAVPDLLSILKHAMEEGERIEAAATLSKLGSEAGADVVADLARCLSDRSQRMRAAAAQALGRLAEKPGEERAVRGALPSLIVALSDSDNGVQKQAADALGKLGRDAEPAVGALVELMDKDSNGDVRWHALVGLDHIARAGGSGAVPVVVKALKDRDRRLRERAMEVLAHLGPPAAAAPVLIELLRDPTRERDERKRAVQALGQMGATAQGAAGALSTALADPASELHPEAAAALGRIGSAGVAVLIAALKNRDTQPHAIQGLICAGPAAKDAVPELVEILRDKQTSNETRINICAVLKNVGAAAGVAAPILAASVNDSTMRRHVLDVLARAGEPAVTPLIDMLPTSGSTLRYEIYATLVQIGAPAVPGLVSVMRNPASTPELRERAIKALGTLGPCAKAAAPELQKLANDTNANIRDSAAAAIKNVQR